MLVGFFEAWSSEKCLWAVLRDACCALTKYLELTPNLNMWRCSRTRHE